MWFFFKNVINFLHFVGLTQIIYCSYELQSSSLYFRDIVCRNRILLYIFSLFYCRYLYTYTHNWTEKWATKILCNTKIHCTAITLTDYMLLNFLNISGVFRGEHRQHVLPTEFKVKVKKYTGGAQEVNFNLKVMKYIQIVIVN